MGKAAPPAAASFRETVAALAAPDAAVPLAVAVSGGPDSLALLKLAADAFPGCVSAITVDHGLRPGSAGEALQVRAIARSLEVPHSVLTLPLALGPANLQAHAREARYAALARECRARGIAALLTAHHADDQAETLVMRLNRGSGLPGLAGIRARERIHGCLVLRPLLHHRRAALRALLEGTGWPVADDPSNRDERFDRTRARRLLRASGGLRACAAAQSAAHLADAEQALAWATQRAWESRVSGRFRLDLEDLPPELARRLCARAFAELDLPVRGGAVARLLRNGGGTLAGARVRSTGPVWTIVPPARPRLEPSG